jgi:hypothetical protein
MTAKRSLQSSGELSSLGGASSGVAVEGVLADLTGDDLSSRIAAVDWLGGQITAIVADGADYRMYKMVGDALISLKTRVLEEIQLEGSSSPGRQERPELEQLRNKLEIVLSQLWDALSGEPYAAQKKILQCQSEDEDKRTSAIWLLADRSTLGSRESLRFLVGEWVSWISQEIEPRLIELTADAIRYNHFAVLALIEHFGSTTALGSYRAPEPAAAETVEGREGADMSRPDQPARQLTVDLRIARQLADMSDPAFFEDDEVRADRRRRKEEYTLILQELRKHAVPVVLRRLTVYSQNKQLPQEIIDLENGTREHLVRMLGYTGGREAVDALARQVVGKEKQRKERQDLLDEYYLKPSLRRGKEAAEILNDTIKESKRTLLILQSLNTLVFLVGLTLLAVGLFVSVRSQDDASRVIGALSAMGGFAGMIALLVRAPLEHIQNAMARLVHVETAFTGFIWELNLAGTFIQSRYVKNGILADEEIKFTVRQIEDAMELSMRQVSLHTEENEPRLVTRINRLEPAGGEAREDTPITIYGQNLLGDAKHKADREGMVAINHIPVPDNGTAWTERQVTFRLPKGIGPGGAEAIWISLFVDGMETNALPFHLMKTGD